MSWKLKCLQTGIIKMIVYETLKHVVMRRENKKMWVYFNWHFYHNNNSSISVVCFSNVIEKDLFDISLLLKSYFTYRNAVAFCENCLKMNSLLFADGIHISVKYFFYTINSSSSYACIITLLFAVFSQLKCQKLILDFMKKTVLLVWLPLSY